MFLLTAESIIRNTEPVFIQYREAMESNGKLEYLSEHYLTLTDMLK